MADIEKVIKGLECCFRGNDCRNCPYREVFNPERPDLDCIDTTREDAIALLKEQKELIEKEDAETDKLKNMCRVLFNRCRVVGSAGGAMCLFCGIRKECEEMSTKQVI